MTPSKTYLPVSGTALSLSKIVSVDIDIV